MTRSPIAALAALALAGVAPPLSAQAPDSPHGERVQPDIVDGIDYRVYDRAGGRSSLEAVVRASVGEEVLLGGE